MKKYTCEEIHQSLSSVGLKSGDLVFMHSALWSLGRPAFGTVSNFIPELQEALLSFLGPHGTIVVPAFSYSVCKSLSFDRTQTPSEGMGQLSEAFRKHPKAIRSANPLQSVVAIGPLAADICAKDTKGAFNVGGSFDRLLELEAKLLLFGTTMQAASIIHLVEERCQVPYRYWKTFKVLCRVGNNCVESETKMFVRDMETDPKLDLKLLSHKMEKDSLVRKAILGSGEVISCTFPDFCDTATKLLLKNPYSLLANGDTVLKGLQQGLKENKT